MTTSLQEIATEHGWTLTSKGVRSQTVYTFEKGDLRIRFCRAGHGSLSVSWRSWEARNWSRSFEVGDKYFAIPLVSREEYVEALLPRVTEEAVLQSIEESLQIKIDTHREHLRIAEAGLSKFKGESNRASQGGLKEEDMHTSTYEVPGYGEIHVIHNGGWDGEAEVVWTEGGKDRRVILPAKLLVRIGMKVAVDFVRSEMIGTLEQMEAPGDAHGTGVRDLPSPG